MDKTIEKASDIEVFEDDIIELGALTVETKGDGSPSQDVPGQPAEPIGLFAD